MPKQDVAMELFYDSAWHDIASADDVYADTPIVIKRGQSDEGSAFRPSSITCSLANDDDTYRTSNPMSPLYGKAGRNTPIRVQVGTSVRGWAEASSWSCDQTQEFRQSPRRGKAWTDVEAGGVLQRIGQWSEPVRSPFYVYNAALPGLLGYWPHEDPKGARTLFSPVPGSSAGDLPGVEFGGDRFSGSNPLANFKNNPGARIQGTFATTTASDTDGWQISCAIKPGSLGTTGDLIEIVNMTTRDGTGYTLFFIDGDTIQLQVDDVAFTSLIDTTLDISGLGTNWNLWQCFIIRSTYSGGTVTIDVYYNTERSDSFVGFSGTFSGVTSQPATWSTGFGGSPNDVGFGHMVGMSGTSPNFFSVERRDAFQGYPGETTADRLDRLCDDADIDLTILGTAADSVLMGPQGVGTFAQQLKEIVDTEDGLAFDAINGIALVFLLRNARYNQDPVLELIPEDLPGLPVEVTDDLDVHNIVTASQLDGGDATARDDTGPLGTLPPPDGVGEARQTVDVNLADPDTDLAQQANWWMRRGTVNLPRFPTVAIDLNALDAARVADVEQVGIGDVITITGMREYVVRLHVLGHVETIGTHTRSIVFTCAPDQQFQVGEWDDTAKRYDLATCTLDGDHTSTDNTLLFAITDDEQWGTSTPYGLLISGELVTVTSMGSRSGSAGAYAQTATVTRSVNGIVKTLPDGAEVHIATPGRWAL